MRGLRVSYGRAAANREGWGKERAAAESRAKKKKLSTQKQIPPKSYFAFVV